MARPTKEGCNTYILRNIPAEIYEGAKKRAATMGITLRAWLIMKMSEGGK